jgi:polyhydroxybutyrate depolymerase
MRASHRAGGLAGAGLAGRGQSGPARSAATGGATTSASGGSGTGGQIGTGGTVGTGGLVSKGGSMSSGGTFASGSSGGSSGGGACPSPALKSGATTKNLTVGSLSGKHILHVPSGYTGSGAVPLVLDFHTLGSSASSWRSGSPHPAVIDKEGVVSAFPDGGTGPSGQAWKVGGCGVAKVDGADVDDVAFAKAVVADIEKVACIHARRVCAVGFSMGGGMSNHFACQAADTFGAVGPASFDLTQQNVGGCPPSRPITVIEWRGKNDTPVCYDGCHSAVVSGTAIDFLGAVAPLQKWGSLDGCTGSARAADSNNCQTHRRAARASRSPCARTTTAATRPPAPTSSSQSSRNTRCRQASIALPRRRPCHRFVGFA